MCHRISKKQHLFRRQPRRPTFDHHQRRTHLSGVATNTLKTVKRSHLHHYFLLRPAAATAAGKAVGAPSPAQQRCKDLFGRSSLATKMLLFRRKATNDREPKVLCNKDAKLCLVVHPFVTTMFLFRRDYIKRNSVLICKCTSRQTE